MTSVSWLSHWESTVYTVHYYCSYNTWSQQAKYQQAVTQEDLTCNFIDSVVMGNYDELDENGSNSKKQQLGTWLANKPYTKTAGQVIARVSPLSTSQRDLKLRTQETRK